MSAHSNRGIHVDVGTPPANLPSPWETVSVHFHNFEDLPWGTGADEESWSPEFECLGRKWALSIFPCGSGGESRLKMPIRIDLNRKSRGDIAIEYFAYILGPDGNQVASSRPAEFRRKKHDDAAEPECWAETIRTERSVLLSATVGGTLSVEVKIRDLSGAMHPGGAASFVPGNPLGENILKRFMDEETADVVLEVGRAEHRSGDARKRAKACTAFPAHRLMLRDGAPMLAELCSAAVEGGTTTTVPIPDIDPDIFRNVLYFVYGGKIRNEVFDKSAKKLIEAADRFGVISLKLEAEARYVESVEFTVENVLDNMLYADSKNCALLKEAVMDFMVEHGDDVMERVSFGSVHTIPSSTMKDLLAAMSRGKKKGQRSRDGHDYHSMRVGTLRKLLHEKGLEVDGSREMMIALLKKKKC